MSLVLDLCLRPFGAGAEPEPALKRCSACQADLPLDSFRRSRSGRMGRVSRCRPCLNDADRAYNANPERKAAEAARVRTAEYRERSRAKDARRNRLPERQSQVNQKNKRRRALKRGVPVDVFSANDLYAAWDDADYAGCYWCDGAFTEADPLHIDHLTPLALGGPHTVANLVPAHASCNASKGAKDPYAYARERHPQLF